MASVNKVILVGNLGRDPDVRYMPDGSAVCTASIATTSSWKDKQTGERRDDTEWHRVVFYNRLAEIACEYLKKGRSVYIEGRLKTRKWQDKATGADKFTTEIIVDQMQMLGQRRDDEPPRPMDRPAASAAPTSGGHGSYDDDIPFAPYAAGRVGIVL